MRFSGSIYDNLRQPGVFKDLEQKAGHDRIRMKRAVLARLRLDDLLSNDSMVHSRARVVASFSDILDGRLFTLLAPQDLDGVKLEILCPGSVARDPASAVTRTVRGWIQKEDGQGLPAFFMATPGGSTRIDIADGIEERKDLNVRTLNDAIEVVVNAGLSKEHAEELERHWFNWDQAIAEGVFKLTPFPGSPASAALALRSFLKRNESTLWEYGIGEAGAEVFREALKCLEESEGKRDKPVRFLEKQLASTQDSINEEVEAVKEIFFHHMFEAIAQGNKAVPEHSARLGQNDNYALPTRYLDRLELFEEDPNRIPLDARIVSGLGGLDSSDYKRVKNLIAADISLGIEQFKRSANKPKEVDLSRLNDAFGRLASEVSEGLYLVSEGIDNAFRKYVWPASGAAVGTALQILWAPSGSVVPTVAAAAAGASIAAAIEVPAGRATTGVSCWLLKNSLVRMTVRELRDDELAW